MSTTDATPAAPPPRRHKRKEEKKSLWQRDLSLGKKDDGDVDDVIEHAPFTPTLPRVNLLPSSVRESMAIGRAWRAVIVGVVLVILASALLWWLQTSRIDQAQLDLESARAQNTQLQTELSALAPVKQMYDEITKLQGVVTTTLASQPEASVVIDALAKAGQSAGGNDIAFTSIDVDYKGVPKAGSPLNPCPNPNPFGTDVTIGCVTFSATAGNRDQVATFLRKLEADDLFVGPYVTSTSVQQTEAAGNEILFSGTAGVSLNALKTKLTDEQIAALLAPPAPAPVPSSSAGAS